MLVKDASGAQSRNTLIKFSNLLAKVDRVTLKCVVNWPQTALLITQTSMWHRYKSTVDLKKHKKMRMSDDIYISCRVAYHLFRANWVTRLPAAMIIITYDKQFLVCHGKYYVRQAGPCLPWGRILVLRHGLACNCIIHFRSGSTYRKQMEWVVQCGTSFQNAS